VRIFRRYALLAAVVVVCLALLTAQTRGTGLGEPGDLVSLVFKPV
jgi:hypothetical protein